MFIFVLFSWNPDLDCHSAVSSCMLEVIMQQLFHYCSNRVEVAYLEAIALKRQEELIREEEAAEQAEIKLKARREAAEKEKRNKKKQVFAPYTWRPLIWDNFPSHYCLHLDCIVTNNSALLWSPHVVSWQYYLHCSRRRRNYSTFKYYSLIYCLLWHRGMPFPIVTLREI